MYIKYDSGMEMNVDRMPISEARDAFSDVIRRARYAHQPTMLTDRGKNAAVVLGPAEYEEYQRLREEEIRRTVAARLADFDAGKSGPGHRFTDADEMAAAMDAAREDYQRRERGAA